MSRGEPIPGTADPLIGRRFYDFVIDRKLAQGGMGAVYLLRHDRFPIRKVLKVILSEYGNHPMIRERFEREARAVASLKHPNIAKIDSVSTIDGQPCMLIPFLEGKPLDDYLAARGGRLPLRDVLHIAAQVGRALHYAHGEGIIHRDLKPGNVFVEPADDDALAIQVLDFGIAKQLRGGPEAVFGTLAGPLGTPAYMAVEQYERAADVTPAADVWALAIMVWEMATGRRPWSSTDAQVLYHRQMNEPPEPPAAGALPAGWEEILRAALHPEPGQRTQSMAALVVPLAISLPSNSPGEPSGEDILRNIAPRWLDGGVEIQRDAPPNRRASDAGDRAAARRTARAALPGPATVTARPAGAGAGQVAEHRPRRRRRTLVFGAVVLACGAASFAAVETWRNRATAPNGSAAPPATSQLPAPTPGSTPAPVSTARPPTSPNAMLSTDVAQQPRSTPNGTTSGASHSDAAEPVGRPRKERGRDVTSRDLASPHPPTGTTSPPRRPASKDGTRGFDPNAAGGEE